MSDAERNDLSVAMRIAERIKEFVAGLRRDRITELIRQHLVQFRLIDSTGSWQAEELAALGDWLLGEDLDTDDALELVGEVARCAGANPYLTEFLDRAKGEALDRLYHKAQTEGATVLPSVVTYGLLLQRLTQAMRNDWRLIEACRDIWLRARDAEDMKSHWTVFERAKVRSIDITINRVLGFHESGRVAPEFGRVLLPMNILEAMFEDIRLGHRHNAASAWPLVKDRPGSWRAHGRW
jgi:sirohydrochlorin ferrochelatase